MEKFFKFVFWVLLSEGVGIFGSVFTISQIPTWYAFLNKPFFSPPNFIFGPVWTTLYFLMGTSVFLVLEEKVGRQKNKLFFLFFLQLFLNFAWSFIFFGMHNPTLAFIDIICLLIAILFLTLNFYKFSKTAGIILVPYILWVSFASLLNLYIILLNPGV